MIILIISDIYILLRRRVGKDEIMKKLSKILTLILVVATLLTAFVIVAAASEEGEPAYVNVAYGTYDSTFESYTVGDAIGVESTAKVDVNGDGTKEEVYPNYKDFTTATGERYIKIAEAYPGGNKYLSIKGTHQSSHPIVYTYLNTSGTFKDTYMVGNYPVMAMDFDIMTRDGSFGLHSGGAANNSSGIAFRPYLASATEKWATGDTWNKLAFGYMGLDNTPYLWQHVTIVIEHQLSNDGYDEFVQKVYVNGSADPTYTETKTLTAAYDGYVFHGMTYFYGQRYEGKGDVAIDNVSYTYFEDGYDTSKISTLIYNESWKAPFGKLAATVSVGDKVNYFDSITDAYEFASANNAIIKLCADVTNASLPVNFDLTVDARKLDENGAPTGEKYVFNPTITSEEGYFFAEAENGIYTAKKAGFQIKNSNGEITLYTKEEFASKLFVGGAGSTVKLFADIDVSEVIAVEIANFTIDLNGHALRKIGYYGNVYSATADGNGAYTLGSEVVSTTSESSTYLFTCNKNGFKVTSTSGRGSLYAVAASADTWLCDGEIVKRDVKDFLSSGNIYNISTSNTTSTFENVDIYGQKFINSTLGNATGLVFNVDNVNFYQLVSDTAANQQFVIFFGASNGMKNYELNVKNSKFFLNDTLSTNKSSGLIRCTSPASSHTNYASSQACTTKLSFVNCDIIGLEASDCITISDSNNIIDSLAFENCRLYGYNSYTHATTASSNGTIANSATHKNTDGSNKAVSIPGAASGFTNMDLLKAVTVTYKIPDIKAGWQATEADIEAVDFNFGTIDLSCTFNKISTKEIEVKLVGNGATKSATLIPGISDLYSDKSLRVYIDTESDALLNQIAMWADKNGNAYDSILGITPYGIKADWDKAYELYPVNEINGQKKYVGGISDANFNLAFLSGFRYNLYIPIDERLTDVSVAGFEKNPTNVFIDYKEYAVFSAIVGTAEAADENTIIATYKVDGIEYSQSWSINAVQYAQMIIPYPEYNTEKAAIGSMVKFIKEAVLCTDTGADVSLLNTIIEDAGLSLTYGTYTAGNAAALDELTGSVTIVQYVIHSGVASLKLYVAENTDISFKTENGSNISYVRSQDSLGTYVILDPMRIYDVIAPITVTTANKSVKFEMLDYLTAMEGEAGMELAKALYEFGVAAKAYREELLGFKTDFNYTVSGISSGDHIVAAAESSRKIKVIDNGSSDDPDTLKNQTLTNVTKVVFTVDGKTVKTVTSAPFEFELVFDTYGDHLLVIDVYDTEGFVSRREIGYTTLADKFDDTFLSFSENFDTATDGSGFNGGSLNCEESVVNGALTLGSGAQKRATVFHPLARTLPKDNEVYYVEFDIKTTSTGYKTLFVIRDGFQSGKSANVFTMSKDFTANKTYSVRIVLDFYSNYATTFVDGEFYSRVDISTQTGNTFTPQLTSNNAVVTIDNVKFSAYGYRVELPEPTSSTGDTPVVVFRFDDFGKSGTLSSFNKLAMLLEKYDATGGYGIVGNWFADQTDEQKQSVVNATEEYTDQGIEIFHHGYYHSEDEYNDGKDTSYETMLTNFALNMDIVEEYFGITMTSFGSPYNHAGDTAIRVVQENFPEITNFMHLDSDPNGILVLTNLNNRAAIESSTGVIDSLGFIARFEANRGESYVIPLAHPGYWDDGELAEFELILRYLNACGVTYMTPSEATEYLIDKVTYKVDGIEDGDRIVSAYETTRRVRVIDPKNYSATPVANKTAGATLISSVEFYVDGALVYTAAEAPYEYYLTFGENYGNHTLTVKVNYGLNSSKTYGPYTYKIVEATLDETATVEEDFSTATDASALHGGVCDDALEESVTNGVLKLTAPDKTYYMNMYPDVSKLTTLDRIYFMEFDFALDSNAYQMVLNVYRILGRNGADSREFLRVTKNYDYVQNSSKTWYNVKIMFDPANDSAIVYVDGYEYSRVNLEYMTNIIFRPELALNKKNAYIDNYKFYAYDLKEKEEIGDPVVILRFDDLKDSNTEKFDRAIEVLNKYGIDASCGVIGHGLGSEELYEAIIRYYENGAEIWHHGYLHEGDEYDGATAESVIENFAKTLDLIKENCGIDITSFGAPYNRTNSVALEAIQEAFPQIKCVMASEDKNDVGEIVNFRAIMTFEGESATGKIDLEGFTETFENYRHNEYVVIYCHPGSWKDADFETFDQLLEYLIGEGVTFMTPSEAADHYLESNN